MTPQRRSSVTEESKQFLGDHKPGLSGFILQEAHYVLEGARKPAQAEVNASSKNVINLSQRADRVYAVVYALCQLEKEDDIDIIDASSELHLPQSEGKITTQLVNTLLPTVQRRKQLMIDPEGEYGRISLGVVSWIEGAVVSRLSESLKKDGVATQDLKETERVLDRLVAPISKTEREILDTQFKLSNELYKIFDYRGWLREGPSFLRHSVDLPVRFDVYDAAMTQLRAVHVRNFWKDQGIDIAALAKEYQQVMNNPTALYANEKVDNKTANIMLDVERSTSTYSEYVTDWLGERRADATTFFLLSRLAEITPQSSVDTIAKQIWQLRPE